MNRCLLGLICLLMGTAAYGEMTATEVHKIFQENSRKNEEIRAELKQLGLTTDTLIDAWDTAEQLQARPQGKLTDLERNELEAARKILDENEAKDSYKQGGFMKAQGKIREKIAALKDIQKQTEEAIVWAKAHPEDLKKINTSKPASKEALDDLQDSVQDNQISALETSNQLNRIEAKYDKQKIGAYFADKLAQFMNSDSFCRAKNHCSNRKAESPVDPEILYSEIFPDLQNHLKRKGGRETYDKVHNRSKGSNSSGQNR